MMMSGLVSGSRSLTNTQMKKERFHAHLRSSPTTPNTLHCILLLGSLRPSPNPTSNQGSRIDQNHTMKASQMIQQQQQQRCSSSLPWRRQQRRRHVAAAAAVRPASSSSSSCCQQQQRMLNTQLQWQLPLQRRQPCSSSDDGDDRRQGRRHRRRRVVAAAGPPDAPAVGEQPRARLAVFVSGGGSNFKAIHAACLKGAINADVVAVVSDVPGCGGVAYAKEHGVAALTYPASKKGLFAGLSKEELVEALAGEGSPHRADYVLLAGYLKLIPAELVRAFPRRMLNVHPGLLPSFGGHGMYGERVHAAVVASGARFSGPTVHFVDEEYDTGPILAQRVVPVLPTDSPKRLAARVLEQEWLVYPHAVAALVDGRVTWREDGVPILWEAN